MTAVASRRSTTPSFRRTVPLFPVRVSGVGAAVPSRRVTNHDLAVHLATTDAWIVGRTGIRSRRVAGPNESTTSLATAAATAALADAGLPPSAVDLTVVATATPDSACPATASRVAAALGTRSGGYDVNGACCGFVHALHGAAALLADPALATILVIGADRFTTLVDPTDRTTAVLFGDGAGAVVLRRSEAVPASPGILGSDLGGDPSALDILQLVPGTSFLTMDGPELFRRATRGLVSSASSALARAGFQAAEVDVFVPHQANARIIGASADRLRIPMEKVVIDVAERANTSAASIPLALQAARLDGRIVDGSHVLLSGIGAGLDWASLLLRWAR
ncbi:MAG: beta-ketoacyl-ACP synthase 3 [Aquihabitans sp.]